MPNGLTGDDISSSSGPAKPEPASPFDVDIDDEDLSNFGQEPTSPPVSGPTSLSTTSASTAQTADNPPALSPDEPPSNTTSSQSSPSVVPPPPVVPIKPSGQSASFRIEPEKSGLGKILVWTLIIIVLVLAFFVALAQLNINLPLINRLSFLNKTARDNVSNNSVDLKANNTIMNNGWDGDTGNSSAIGISNSAQARNARRKSDLLAISQVLQQYALVHNNSYPATPGLSESSSIGGISTLPRESIVNISVPGNILEAALVPRFISSLPKDPVEKYYYSYISNGRHFKLIAVQEEADLSTCQEKIGNLCFYSLSL